MPSVTEEQIAQLVRVFYGRARQHPDLGKVFNGAVADWEQHYQVVQDFWSHVLLGTQRYQRSPFPVHMGLPIKREHFGQWLELFCEAVAATLPEAAGAQALARAEHMAQSFRAGLFPFDKMGQAAAGQPPQPENAGPAS